MDLAPLIASQREKIKKGGPQIQLSDSCRLGDGIVPLTAERVKALVDYFEVRKETLSTCFFIPASGSGSRMFQEWTVLLNKEYDDRIHQEREAEQLKYIEKLALYTLVSPSWKSAVTSGNFRLSEWLSYLLTEKGLRLNSLPKGLIPFHNYAWGVRTPFEEHLLQAAQIGGQKTQLHFTVSPAFKQEIVAHTDRLRKREAIAVQCVFSEQSPETDAIAFDEEDQPLKDDAGKVVTRPSGHGALIKNLNETNADIVFIRNIDNIQHQHKAEPSIQVRKALAGALLKLREAVHNVLSKIARDHAFESSIKTLNETFDLRLTNAQLTSPTAAYEVLNRPIRVAGMVKNEEEMGGGPFWVSDESGRQSRQIVEAAQLSHNAQQSQLLRSATHFNPVELVCSLLDFKGKPFDLDQFVHKELFFVVNKTHQGKSIRYIESPGLWNGAMFHWLTVFYEIDRNCFSPVKTVSDLLHPLHQPS